MQKFGRRDGSVLQAEMAKEEPTRSLPTAITWQQRTPNHVKKAHLAHQASRDDRYQQMTILRAQGLTQREVATRMGMSERAVHNWLKRGTAPTNEHRMRRRSAFDPYAAFVLQRWQAGVHDATHLYEEIRARGFSGTVRIVQRAGSIAGLQIGKQRKHHLRDEYHKARITRPACGNSLLRYTWTWCV